MHRIVKALSALPPGARWWPAVHFIAALWGLLALLTLAQRSRVVPVALVVGPWREALYPPWLYFSAALCGIVVAWRGWQFLATIWERLQRHGTSDDSPLEAPGQTRSHDATRVGWWDILLLGLITSFSSVFYLAFRARRNPLGVYVGMDSPTFLTDIVAIGLGRWDLYNTDKRVPYPFVSATLADWTGMSYLESGQIISLVSIIALAPVTYLIARPFAGRFVATMASLLVLSVPILHPYAVQTSSYAFFYLVVNLAVAAAVWAAATRRVPLYLAAGALAFLCVATQIKGLTVVAPVLGVLAALSLTRGLRRAILLLAALAFPLLAGTYLSSKLPIQYTRLSWLIAHHREEVHQDMPYQWKKKTQPNLNNPSPISRFLPKSLEGTEVEALAAVLLGPPNSDVVVFRKTSDGRRTWNAPQVLERTSIPPLEVRLLKNVEGLKQFLPEIYLMLVLLLSLGVAGALLPMPRGIPATRTVCGWIIVAALISVWGSLSLKFHIRYLMQALPAASILIVHGANLLARQWLGRAPRFWSGLASAAVGWLAMSLAMSTFTQSAGVWFQSARRLPGLERYIGLHDRENNIRQGQALLRTADWLETALPKRAVVYDCSPMPIWILRPRDSRFLVPSSEGERYQDCQRVIHQKRPTSPTYVVASDVSEYRGTDTPRVSVLLRQPERWKLIFAVNPESGEELDDAGTYRPTHNAVMVFEYVAGQAPK